MPLTEIKRNIEDAAKKEAKALRDSSAKERDAVLSEAAEKVKAIRKAADAAIKEELARLDNEYKASAELEEKNIMLASREIALKSEMSSIRSALIKRIKANKDYGKLFKNAIRNAVSLYPEKNFTILTSKSDAKLVDLKGAKVEYGNINGGLVISSNDKSVRIDATLERLIDSHIDDIKSAVLEHLPISGKSTKHVSVKQKTKAKKQVKKKKSTKKKR